VHKHKVKQNKQNVITFVNQSGEPDCPFSALASENWFTNLQYTTQEDETEQLIS